MTRELEQAAQDAIRFLNELPADLGRGSWNGFRVQIARALRAALAAEEPAAPSVPAPGYCKHCKQYTIEDQLPAAPSGEGA